MSAEHRDCDSGSNRETTGRPAPAPGYQFRGLAWGVLGLVLLTVWVCWWANSVRRDRLVSGPRTWLPVLPVLGADFIHNLDHPSRVWVAGGNPYQDDAVCTIFPYPPLVPRLFAWSSLLTPSSAMIVWLVALGVMAVTGALAAWKTRRALGLDEIHPAAVVAAVAFSTPVVLAMERGNCDLLIVPLVLIFVASLSRDGRYSDFTAGALLAVAPWVKVYPGVLLLGLIALRRWRALPGFLAAGVAIGLTDVRGFGRFLENNRRMASSFLESKAGQPIHPCEHSLTECWAKLWAGTPLGWLSGVPGVVVSVGLLLPLACWVSYRVYQCRERSSVAYPYLMWLLAAATFVPPLANDYNLFFLPMAALAVWDRRDPVFVHMVMGLLLLWWQPLHLPVGGDLLFVFKLLGLAAVAVSLTERARARESDGGRERSAGLPHFASRGVRVG